MEIYVVKAGDTVNAIGAKFGIGVSDITYANQMLHPYRLAVGQALLIPDGQIERDAKKTVMVRGYAYPFISRWVLEQTLPYLSGVVIFSYGFTEEGDLTEPQRNADWMIKLIADSGATPILALTPLDEQGVFNSNLIHSLLSNPEAKQNLIDQLYVTLQKQNFGGIDIDFEYIYPEDKEGYVRFVHEVKQAVSPDGYTVSVALAPKISNDQKGILYEGKDYALLGEAADYVHLMTYEWGYTYGPPMATAPLNKVREVIEYALTEIPAHKINLGIPNYGYNWTLPYIRGKSRAQTIGDVEAVQIAIDHGAEILFDETAMSPYFRYTENGNVHEVWFEDVRSIREKFSLIKQYHLNGMGYWQIMQLFRANWLLLEDTFTIRKE